jgi:hypothetical protein
MPPLHGGRNGMTRRQFILLLGGALAAALPLAAYAQESAAKIKRHTLSLTSAQRADIWRSLHKRANDAQIAAGLNVGEIVPDTMHQLSFSRSLRRKVPGLHSYRYVLVHGQVLIVYPKTKKIVVIVSK